MKIRKTKMICDAKGIIMKGLIAVLLGSMSIDLNAQSDYLVTVRGDTIYGEGFLQAVGERVESLFFIRQGERKRQLHQSITLNGAFIDGAEYRVIPFNGYRFMRVEKTGYLSLLRFRDDGMHSFALKLLYKRDGDMTEVPKLTFRSRMVKYLADCEPVSLRIKAKEFGPKDLDEIIDLYNECIDRRTQNIALLAELQSESDTVTNVDESSSLALLKDLRATYTDLNGTNSDVNAILRDIEKKISSGEEVPDYLMQALKNNLGESGELNEIFESLEAALK